MADTAAFWSEFQVAPVEIALPGDKVGLTLRAYRQSDEVTATDVSERETEEDIWSGRDARDPVDEADLPDFEWTKEQLDEIESAPAEDEAAERFAERGRPAGSSDDQDDADESDEDEDDEDAPPVEEVPVFLSHKGKVLLFRSAEGLVAFVKSGAPHDLTQIDGWAKLAKSVKASHVKPEEDDSYELDLVVENLRRGHDAWEPSLVVSAGEIARDLGYALQLKPVVDALAAGSPLDDLDEALRASDSSSGVGGFFARRKLKKIGAEQAALGWRTIIGKISGAVDWRD